MFYSEHEVLEAIKLKKTFLDVRAPIEFEKGSLPNAVNLPILSNEERHLVGTEYKSKGQDSAIELGQQLVSGEVKLARVKSWIKIYKQNPDTLLYCFRGGKRSAFAQNWLKDAGLNVLRIEGGYKKYRQYLIEQLIQLPKRFDFLILSGQTGSGKTKLLPSVSSFLQVIDLENLANHRGSAFGNYLTPQPSQTDFENRLSSNLLSLNTNSGPILLEDESRMIGSCFIPDSVFIKMRTSNVVVIEEKISNRIENTFKEYVEYQLKQLSTLGDTNPLATLYLKFEKNILKIQKRLGGENTSNILLLMKSAFEREPTLDTHSPWIDFLLRNYYDPLYDYGLTKKQNRIIFRGSTTEVLQFLRERTKT